MRLKQKEGETEKEGPETKAGGSRSGEAWKQEQGNSASKIKLRKESTYQLGLLAKGWGKEGRSGDKRAVE